MSKSERASPGGSTALWLMCTVRSTLVNVPVFSPHMAQGRTTSASRAVSVMNASWTTTNSSSRRRMFRTLARLGSDTAGFVALIQSIWIEPCSAWWKIFERVGWRCPVWDDRWVDVPKGSELPHVLGVVPVAEAREVAVCPRFPRILGCGLPIHLQNGAAPAANQAPDHVDVIDLHGSGGRLHRLVDALEAGRDQG